MAPAPAGGPAHRGHTRPVDRVSMADPIRSIARRARDLNPINLPPIERGTTTMPPSEVHRAMRLGVAEGVTQQVHLSLTAGTLATGLALLLGANSFALGILAALPVI